MRILTEEQFVKLRKLILEGIDGELPRSCLTRVDGILKELKSEDRDLEAGASLTKDFAIALIQSYGGDRTVFSESIPSKRIASYAHELAQEIIRLNKC